MPDLSQKKAKASKLRNDMGCTCALEHLEKKTKNTKKNKISGGEPGKNWLILCQIYGFTAALVTNKLNGLRRKGDRF